MVRWPDVFDPGTGILDRFVNVSYSRLNRIICTYTVRITISISEVLEGFLLLPIPQCTEDNTMNVNVMCCLWCVEKRIEKHHYMVAKVHVFNA